MGIKNTIISQLKHLPFKIKACVLYGSFARGSQTPDSDNDDWKATLIQLGKVSSEIEPEVTWSRYPGIDNDALWIPSEEYSAADADEIKKKCEQNIKNAKEFPEWWFKEY